jgi:RHS repeat-associated protein
VTATKYYYASDQINSTRIITNSSGAVVYSAVFDPYGGLQKQWVNTYQPSLKFSGKERESKSEMDYFGARYYDHLKYRFISVDPVINKGEALVNPQLWNLYSYCRNNPVTFFDPDGRWSGPTHDEIIDKAFSEGNNKLPDHIKRIFKEASALVDQDQLPEHSFMHAMRGPNEDASTAENRMNEYVSLKINEFKTKLANKDKYGAYLALGEAMHPLMDSTAPAHEGFQVWRGLKFIKLPAAGVHGTRDAFSKLTPARLTTSVDNIRRINNEATH